jgi:hypothetical protein
LVEKDASKVFMMTSFFSEALAGPYKNVNHDNNKNEAVGMYTFITNQLDLLRVNIVTNAVEYTLPVEDVKGSVSKVLMK